MTFGVPDHKVCISVNRHELRILCKIAWLHCMQQEVNMKGTQEKRVNDAGFEDFTALQCCENVSVRCVISSRFFFIPFFLAMHPLLDSHIRLQ